MDDLWARLELRTGKTANGCHPWQGHLYPSGYGTFLMQGKQVRVHRLAYEMYKGRIPKGKIVLHSCDNKACVNYTHLSLGTNAQNSADMVNRGRAWRGGPIKRDQTPWTHTPLPKPKHLRYDIDLWQRCQVKIETMPYDCWEWRGMLDPSGYGLIKRYSKPVRAHRAMYELYKGPIPAGMFVLHSCDNPLCVNPVHLRAGTHAENMAEMAVKGRAPRGGKGMPGEQHPLAKLTEIDIPRICAMRQKGHTHAAIAQAFNIERTAVGRVLAARRWGHVECVRPARAQNLSAKLTDDKIPEIRHLYETGEYSQREIGDLFGVTQTTIHRVLNGQLWAHVA